MTDSKHAYVDAVVCVYLTSIYIYVTLIYILVEISTMS